MAAQITAVIIFWLCLHSLSRKKFHGTLRQHSAVLQRSFSCLVSVCTVPLRYSRH